MVSPTNFCQSKELLLFLPWLPWAGNTKGGSITVLLTSCLTGLDKSVLPIKTKIVSPHTVDYKPVKQEVNGTVILPPYCIICLGKCHT
jgi:hypothetical protein